MEHFNGRPTDFMEQMIAAIRRSPRLAALYATRESCAVCYAFPHMLTDPAACRFYFRARHSIVRVRGYRRNLAAARDYPGVSPIHVA